MKYSKVNKNQREHSKMMGKKRLSQEFKRREEIFEVFNRYDLDQDGFLNKRETELFVRDTYKKKHKNYESLHNSFFIDATETLMAKSDVNNDGRISK